MQPYALKAGEGWTYRCGIDFTVKASEVREGSGGAVLEYITKKGEEPEDHTHHTEDEMFYELEGAITFRCGGETFNLKAGDFIFLPRGIQHRYTIPRDKPVRLLVITVPVRDGAGGGIVLAWGIVKYGSVGFGQPPSLGSLLVGLIALYLRTNEIRQYSSE